MHHTIPTRIYCTVVSSAISMYCPNGKAQANRLYEAKSYSAQSAAGSCPSSVALLLPKKLD